MKRNIFYSVFCLLILAQSPVSAQKSTSWWHGKERSLRYRPDGEDFVITNGEKRFNRALYGTNTAFRAEAGDLPEFALYMPGMGGNLKFGLIAGNSSKWLFNAKTITARYRPGSMLYEIKDPMLGNGTLQLTILALSEGEGIVVKAEGQNIPSNIKLFAAFGGATGKKFSRDGDIGADPESSFYLKPEYCKDNIFNIKANTFTLFYGSKKPLSEEERYEIQHFAGQKNNTTEGQQPLKQLAGVFPASAQLKIGDAAKQESPLQFLSSTGSVTPALTAQMPLKGGEALHFLLQNPEAKGAANAEAAQLLAKAEGARKTMAGRIKINTPDPYINTLGGALGLAADAIWEDPSFLHGAVAWRMRLNAWRGAYAADALGWHDRARKHFSSYALSQLTTPATGPVIADTALHLARHVEKLGTAMFSSGYICRNPNGDFRPHHYDMNLVFVDQLLTHFQYTGDTAYIREMWPLLQRHFDWEKRNFDTDGDGLYDAYCCIWASDALQYSGGGVTHSSSYNYRANKLAAELAKLIGKDPTPYQQEAHKILNALQTQLWMPSKGWYAEYKDLLGGKKVHPSAGLWTIYHAIDSRVPNSFQAYQSLRYIDTHIPRIPIRAKGLSDTSLYTISTTNWQPYTWSLNNVALAEVLHTAQAYWQGGRSEEAYKLWKSSLVESMYLSSSPGNIQQLSFYDAIRGELYRDFADPVGMAARTLTEGLFGIQPDALKDTLYIQPGLPAAWNNASLSIPNIQFSFVHKTGLEGRKADIDEYTVIPAYPKTMNLNFRVKPKRESVAFVKVNGNPVPWNVVKDAVGSPILEIKFAESSKYVVEIGWNGYALEKPAIPARLAKGEMYSMSLKQAVLADVYDPQGALMSISNDPGSMSGMVKDNNGHKTFFLHLRQGQFEWWHPLTFEAVKPIEMIADEEQKDNTIKLRIRNNTSTTKSGNVTVNGWSKALKLSSKGLSYVITIPATALKAGSNKIRFGVAGKEIAESIVLNWNVQNNSAVQYEKVNLAPYFNSNVTNIFKTEYLSPRPARPTLQLPIQGIGNWCYPMTTPNIDDAGLRQRAGAKGEIVLAQGVPLATPASGKNILFTSQWDNYPDSVQLPLSGKASHAYFLMAGSTNPMQTRFTNGEVTVLYKDGTSEKLELKNPENWWPIEQDYFVDGYAFTTNAAKPVRVYLKNGQDTRTFNQFTTIKGFSTMAIDGGAATVLDLPLNKEKELAGLVLKTMANDVVIGLMSVTLVR